MNNIDSIQFANYSEKEELLNTTTHIFGAILTLIATVLCVIRSVSLERTDYLLVSLIYCTSMLIVYVCSSVYHALSMNRAKKLMRIVDHSAIYLMIVGTITPYMTIAVARVNHTLAYTLLAVCWLATIISIVLTVTSFNKTKVIRMILYIVIGACAFSSLFVTGDKFDPRGVFFVVAGCIAYILGVILYGVGKKKPYFHAVFHIFVILGSLLHFLGLYLYVFV